jgi:hypothetical protein
MSQIFGRADQVIAWLGPSDRDSDQAMQLLAIRRLNWTKLDTMRPSSDWHKANKLYRSDRRFTTSIIALCERPYWTRLWMFQELKAAKPIVLMCGGNFAPWSSLEDFCLARGHLNAMEGSTRGWQMFSRDTVSLAERMVRLQTEPIDTSLWNLLRTTRDLFHSRSLDAVYAILGIATKGHEGIEADYHACVHCIINLILHNKYASTPPASPDEVKDDLKFLEAVFKGTPVANHPFLGAFKVPNGIDSMNGVRLVEPLSIPTFTYNPSAMIPRIVERDDQVYFCPCKRCR